MHTHVGGAVGGACPDGPSVDPPSRLTPRDTGRRLSLSGAFYGNIRVALVGWEGYRTEKGVASSISVYAPPLTVSKQRGGGEERMRRGDPGNLFSTCNEKELDLVGCNAPMS